MIKVILVDYGTQLIRKKKVYLNRIGLILRDITNDKCGVFLRGEEVHAMMQLTGERNFCHLTTLSKSLSKI